MCGDDQMPAAPPLRENAILGRIAREHSLDMGLRRFFSHTNPDGIGVGGRYTAAGYDGMAGENIHRYWSLPEEVVAGWLASAGHCRNLMRSEYVDAGVGYAYVDGSPSRYYWTLDLGGPWPQP